MGFIIGGIRDIRSATRRRGRTPECTAVAEFTGLWGWDVAPGAQAAADRCSCGESACPLPGAHPLGFAPEVPAGATLDEAAKAWSLTPGAAVLLPVGRSFDVLDVAEPAGHRALVRMERMGLPLGPVSATPDGRAQFFVAPGPAPSFPSCCTGWDGTMQIWICAAWARASTSLPRRRIMPASARRAGCVRRPWQQRTTSRRPGY